MPFLQLRSATPLLVAILLLIVGGPLLQREVTESLLSTLLHTAITLTALFSLPRDRGRWYAFLAIGIVCLTSQWLVLFSGGGASFLVVRDLSSALFFGIILSLSVRRLFYADQVSVDTIARAVVVYLLIGFVFSNLHAAVEQLGNGSYATAYSPMESEKLSFYRHFIYYSFVTLTTLGYGDIVPVTDFARSLSIIEAVVGQLYLAILIPKLVSVYVSEEVRR